ncbi:PKD domain-containing protein [Parasediminibacterium sp. JCM 36343]|uniref:PKD domain-containing protein n=1 Tax=Parasediminibacterium sp. JCM 36343 TaxID=3374279 RepID=UPI00397DD15D
MASCSREADLTPTGTGTATSDPTKPTYTPPSPTGDTSSTGGGTGTGGGTTTGGGSIDSLAIAYTNLTPCAATNSVASFTLSGINIPSNATYEWYFGDGQFVTTGPSTVSNTYKTAGTYTVLVKIDTAGKSIKSYSKAITVVGSAGSPIAAFTAQLLNPGNIGNNYAFNGSSSKVASGTITTFFWDFGDGSSNATNNSYVTHAYNQTTASQDFSVTLKVTSDAGCTGSKTTSVNVPAGTANTAISGSFSSTATSPCSPSTEKFTFTSAAINVPAGAVYNWTFGDGATATGNPVQKTYTTSKIYTVAMNIVSSSGVSLYSVSQSVTAFGQNVSPVASMDIQAFGNTVNSFTFQSNSSVGNGTITSNAWDFGDGSTATTPSITKTYTQNAVATTYTVKLVSTSSAGCTASILRTLTVPAK